MALSSSENLGDKVALLTRLVAIGLVGGKTQLEQIRLLSIAGMKPSEIAELIGTTGNTVNVALSALRKGNKMNLKSQGGKDDV